MVDENDVSVAMQLGEISGIIAGFQTSLASHAKDSKGDRAEMYKIIHETNREVALLKNAVATLKSEVKAASGSISDFEKLKNQADGAGKAVMFLATIGGGALLTMIGYFGKVIIKKFGG
ncbi:MAG: hypothetical protein JKY82_09795 [Rhizobiaceae bacterium]|nr:hypothetical protein [Rhizobiaceae bacterium]